MKTLLLYLLSRIKGKPISWVQAQYDANDLDMEKEICSRVESASMTVADIFTFGKYSARKAVSDTVKKTTDTSDSFLARYFLGRLLLCVLKRSTNSEFLFYGKRATP